MHPFLVIGILICCCHLLSAEFYDKRGQTSLQFDSIKQYNKLSNCNPQINDSIIIDLYDGLLKIDEKICLPLQTRNTGKKFSNFVFEIRHLRGFRFDVRFVFTERKSYAYEMILTFRYCWMNIYDIYGYEIQLRSDHENSDNYLRAYHNLTSLEGQNITQLINDYKGMFPEPIAFLSLEDYVRFDQRLSPLIFKDSRIKGITLHNLRDTFFERNLIKFSSLNESKYDAIKRLDLNSSVTNLLIVLCNRLKFNSEILNEQIFELWRQL